VYDGSVANTDNQDLKPAFVIHAYDGGGLRGILSARLSQLLEVDERGGVDMYAGTSTGAITAAGLSLGMSIDQIIALYREHASTIFAPRDIRDRLSPGDELHRADYVADGLVKALTSAYGANTLMDTDTHLLTVSFDLHRWRPKITSTFDLYDNNPDRTRLVDIVARSCSAPTYFPSYTDPATGNQHVDGGLVANSPGMCAVVEALGNGIDLERIHLLSFGTGFSLNTHIDDIGPMGDQKFDGGLLDWAPHLLPAIMEGSQHMVDFQLKTLLGDRYCRVQVPMSPTVPKLDAIDSLDDMIKAAEMFAANLGLDAARRWYERQSQ